MKTHKRINTDKTTEENLIHLRLEYAEGIDAKRQLLNLEKDSLNITQIIKNYHHLRLKKLQTKIILYNKIKNLLIDIRKIKRTLPKIEIPKILQKEKDIKETKSKIVKKEYGDDIQYQLQEIQDKLNALNK